MKIRTKRWWAWLVGTLLVVPAGRPAAAQPADSADLTLDRCLADALRHHPLAAQQAWVDRSAELLLAKERKTMWPQVQLSGQASWQSDVTRVPLALPGLTIPSLDRDQYRFVAELAQPLTDRPQVRRQEALVRARTAVESRQLAVDLYGLREQVAELYFGILLQDAYLRQLGYLERDLREGLARVRAAIDSGTALRSQADLLQVELLTVGQRKRTLTARRQAFAEMLSAWTGLPLGDSTRFAVPPVPALPVEISRPELQVLALQQKQLEAEKAVMEAIRLPRAQAFLQGGYGRPGLNLLDNRFDLFCLGGIRIGWNLSRLYTLDNDREILSVRSRTLDIRRDAFLLQTQQQLVRQQRAMEGFEDLLRDDEAILSLRESVMATGREQLEQGVITALDYLSLVKAADLARQERMIHDLQRRQAAWLFLIAAGGPDATDAR
jgi:outer membrane protein TolC